MNEMNETLVSDLMPPEIEKKQPGWKKRRKERMIMLAMHRATQPNSGWNVFQKVIKMKPQLGSWSGKECCELMMGLAEDGYLCIVGNDNDCGHLYELNR